jgi:uncharacterized protein involved in outer membrane biogenesis
MKRVLKLLLSLPFLLAFGALGCYALGGFVVAPWWIKREAPQYLKTHLNATGSVGEISINPFKFTIDMRNVVVTEAGGTQPAIAFDRLFVDFEAGSLFRRAWTFSDITLEHPRLNLEIDANDALNIAKLVPVSAPAPQEKSSGLPRLLLEKVALKQGRISLTDTGFGKPATARLEPLEFELHDLSTLPDQRGEYTLSARLPAGGTLGWRGTVSLAPIASAGQIQLQNLKLATLWQFLQDKVLIEEPGGSAELSLQYQAGYAANKLDASASNMQLKMSEITLRQKGPAEPALTAGELALSGGMFNLAERKIQFAGLTLQKVLARTVIDAEGNTNWARLAAPRAVPAAKPDAETQPADSAPWQAAIDAINVSDVRLYVLDQGFVQPVTAEIARAGIRAGFRAVTGAQTAVNIDGITIELDDIRVGEAGAKASLLTLASANLSGGAFDLAQKKFTADGIKVNKLVTAVVRGADGNLNLAKALARKPSKPTEPSTITAEIRAIELGDSAVSIQDRTSEPALALDLQAIRVLARNVSSSARAAIPFDASLQIKQGGALRAQGSVSPEQQRATAKLEARNIALTPLAALVTQHTTLKLSGGTARAAGQLDWNGQGKAAGVRYAGTAGLDDFRLDHESNGERLVAWKGLLAEGIQVDTAKRLARIEDVRLSAPSGKIVIAKDKSTNFAGLMRPSPAAQKQPAARGAPAAQSEDTAFNTSVERIHVANGELDFTDQSLVLPFAALIREFTGTVTGLSTQPGTRAGLKLEGRVDEFGQAQVNGTINLSEPKAYTDITVSFRNVAMSPLSPYSATFAGRRIASGKLSLDLQYKLNNSQLLGENKVLLEQFTLGERVESPTAINLPLDLAIALLTDSSGKIDLSVPVRGNVDSPEFAYGHLVWQAIRTVLTNIVTAPFRALASLFGGGTEKVDAVGFEAGRAQLAPPEREKLTRIAGVLKQRPQLRLMVEGRYDPRHDGAALRNVAARRTLADRQGIKLADANDTAPVNFDNAKTQRAIEALLEERAGAGAIDKFKADYEKTTGKEARRVNPALALVGRGSTDREFYEAMFKRVAELQPLADTALPDLARERSNAIAAYMSKSAGLDASRIAAKPAASVSTDKSAEVTSALSLDAGK